MIKKSISFLIAILFAITPALALDADALIPIGHTTGIKMYADGVIVIGSSEVITDKGSVSPAEVIEKGDVITKINGRPVSESEEFRDMVRKNGEKPIELTVQKAGKEMKLSVTPVTDSQGECKLGLWVRDSMAGIGTITFYDPKSNTFGALGHGICDSDTGVLIPFKDGAVMESTVEEVKHGKVGEPGELRGNYNLKEDYGVLLNNTNSGIFGKVLKSKEFLKKGAIPVADKNEIKCGPATILSNIDGDDVREYQIEITKIYPSNEKDTKNMMIKICDKELIEKTGGIVQGMSGSPILQNGKIVGAVTHVLVNDPTKGYGIFIENMLSAAD